jgi:carboxylesterase type B
MWFGQSTNGVRRFAKPIKFTSSEVFEAAKFSDDCPGQLSSLPPGGNAVATMLLQQWNNASENCLSVNVWIKPQSGDKTKAILVWMYGGVRNSSNSDIEPVHVLKD